VRSRALILAATLALWACAGARPARPVSEAGGPSPADYFPLAIGNSWTFLDRSPQQREPARRTVRILRRDAEGYFIDDAKGALRADRDCLHDRSRRLLCVPLQVGRTWISVVGPSATERYEIVATGETVTVPAGTFRECVRVRSQIRAGKVDSVAELTYAPDVGPVRLETFAVVGGTAVPQVRGELEAYHVRR
jgi:hypothetical protein